MTSFDVRIEPMSQALSAEVVSWADSRTTHFHWTGNTMVFPASTSEFAAHGALIAADSNRQAFVLWAGGAVVGYFEFGSVDRSNRSGRLERFLINPTARGGGLGQTAMHLIEAQFFADVRMHRFELVVATDNRRAVACYEKSGFTIEGTLRESRKFGEEWRSMHVMGLLRSAWEEFR